MTNHQHRPRNPRREEERTKNVLDRSGGGATGHPADPQRYPSGAARFDEQKHHDSVDDRKPPKGEDDAANQVKNDQSKDRRRNRGQDKETQH